MTFCDEHLPAEKHDCLVDAEREGKKRAKLFSYVELALFLLLLGVVWWLVNKSR